MTHHGLIRKHKETLAQTHLCLGALGPSSTHADRFTGHVLGTVLGGSISSRLFQNVREKRGLVYSISAGLSGFMDTGSLSIYAATSKERIDTVLSLISDEVKGLVDKPVPERRVAARQGQPQGRPDVVARGHRAHGWATSRGTRSTSSARSRPTKPCRSIDAVTSDDVTKLARKIFSRPQTLAVIGNLKGAKLQIPELA